MSTTLPGKVAVVGAGISGIATGHILQKNGFEVVIFERASKPGGVWAAAYPDVQLQNIFSHYHFTDFPWPFKPDFHPSGKQIMEYLARAIEYFKLDVRLEYPVIQLIEQENGWQVKYQHKELQREDFFDYVIISTGQYTQDKARPHFEGTSQFRGEILTEMDIKDISRFKNKQVAIVGFGKSALDMTTYAGSRAAAVHHIFRTPHWLLPEKIFGIHFTHALFNRFGTVMMRSWVQPSGFESFLHNRLPFLVHGFWKMIQGILKFEVKKHGFRKGKEAKQRLAKLLPDNTHITDLGSRTALTPATYLSQVAAGKIIPHHAVIRQFEEDGVLLSDGEKIKCDMVLLCVGFGTPKYPYLPEKYRRLLENQNDGTQLYRHILHPQIPRLAFSGFNHGFMHVPAVEIATQWISAHIKGELQLPSTEKMEESIQRVTTWKRTYMSYEPARAYATNTRFQQYIDVLLKDIGVSPYRKMPNVFAELFARYRAADYKGVTDEYIEQRKKKNGPRKPLKVHT